MCFVHEIYFFQNNIDLVVNEILNDLINAVVKCDEKELNKDSYIVSNENCFYYYNISSQNTNSKFAKVNCIFYKFFINILT